MINNKSNNRKKRIRAKINGTKERPRLSVFRSNKYIFAQLIDDEKGSTIAAADGRKIKGGKNNIETARKIGIELAKMAQAKKIKETLRQGLFLD